VKIDNGTGGSRETSTGGSGSRPGRSVVDERGRESINFFAELKRRNVLKVAVAYIIAGWALSQGIAQVFPVFDVPNWIIRLIVLLIILGLPVALVLAWMFEITPEGIKRTATADAMPAAAKPKKYTWLYVVVIGVAISVGLFLLGRYTAGNSGSAARTGTSELAQKSIAVLPFDNLSRDPDNVYFTEGVQDEILTRLAKVADLKVISRTSTQHFKSSPEDLPQIAKQLGVMNILEGSVQKAGDQVRVNVQLINALTDAHLWADTYDRKLTDIFAVESEIAKTIAETLQAKLTGSEKSSIAKTQTVNPEAYELYLRGKFFAEKRTGADLRKSIEYYDQAIAKDPGYPLAYVGLANSQMLLSVYGALSPKEAASPARAALKKALDLDDSLAQAHASSGLLATLELDLHRSVSELERAIQLNPNDATAHHWIALPLMTLGQFDRGVVEAKRAIELDPLSLIINADLCWIYFNGRHYDQAEAQARKTLEMDPRFYVAHFYLGEALQFQGKLTDGIAEFQKSIELNNDPYSYAMLGQAYARQGKTDEAQKVLARLREQAKSQYVSPYAFAVVLAALGDKAHALDELEHGYDDAGFYISLIKVDPLFDPLRGDPRFEALVQRVIGPKTEGRQ
jgi:TolB-like protein/Tfp pilus assembly protein PilF